MNSKQGLVIVDNMKTEFGKRESIGYAKIYESPERVKEIERAHIIERNIATSSAQIDGKEISEQNEIKK